MKHYGFAKQCRVCGRTHVSYSMTADACYQCRKWAEKLAAQWMRNAIS